MWGCVTRVLGLPRVDLHTSSGLKFSLCGSHLEQRRSKHLVRNMALGKGMKSQMGLFSYMVTLIRAMW